MKRVLAVLLIVVMTVGSLTGCSSKSSKYEEAIAEYNEGNIDVAGSIFAEIAGYKDADEYIGKIKTAVTEWLIGKTFISDIEIGRTADTSEMSYKYYVCSFIDEDTYSVTYYYETTSSDIEKDDHHKIDEFVDTKEGAYQILFESTDIILDCEHYIDLEVEMQGTAFRGLTKKNDLPGQYDALRLYVDDGDITFNDDYLNIFYVESLNPYID